MTTNAASDSLTCPREPVRVLVIPGLHGSGPTHWQSWLQARTRGLRVQQVDWAAPDVHRWAQRIATTLAAQPPARWVAVAHSFGCLALLRHLATHANAGPHGIRSALLVAPADPDKFGVAPLLPAAPLRIPAVLMASETDPWMSIDKARAAAQRWGASLINLGDAGHINVAAGFGPLPPAMSVTTGLIQRAQRERRLERSPAEAEWLAA